MMDIDVDIPICHFLYKD